MAHASFAPKHYNAYLAWLSNGMQGMHICECRAHLQVPSVQYMAANTHAPQSPHHQILDNGKNRRNTVHTFFFGPKTTKRDSVPNMDSPRLLVPEMMQQPMSLKKLPSGSPRMQIRSQERDHSQEPITRKKSSSTRYYNQEPLYDQDYEDQRDPEALRVQRMVHRAKSEAKTVKVIDGGIYIDYKYVGPLPRGVYI